MPTKMQLEKMEKTREWIARAREKFRQMPDYADGIITAAERRMAMDLVPSDGQVRYLRALAQSIDVREDGKPSKWTGKWAGTDW